jgi:6-phosphogluconolactonase
MSLFRRALALTLGALTFLIVGFLPSPAGASSAVGSVYVLSNQVSGNSVIEYARSSDGSLTPAGSFPTGGTGTSGGLGSQGAVIVDRSERYVFAVNAGSHSVTSFRVNGRGGLSLVGTVDSGGATPTSLTTNGQFLYVLNAGGTGNITGFSVAGGTLTPLAGSTRPLSGAATAPAQVSFTPDGRRLLVTERATNRIDLYQVGADGLAAGPITTASPGVTPFGFDFDRRGNAIVSEAFGGQADASAVSSLSVSAGGLSVISASVPTTETAACWIATTIDGRYAYAGNAGTSSISGYAVAPDGQLSLLTTGGKTGSAAAGVADLADSRDSRFLYARLGNGTVGAYEIGSDGSLTDLGAVPGLPVGAAGIAAR